VCSRNQDICTRVSVLDQNKKRGESVNKIDILDDRGLEDRTPLSHFSKAVQLQRREPSAFCCGFAKAMFYGGSGRLVAMEIVDVDEKHGSMVAMISGWAMSMGCNLIWPGTCAVSFLLRL
jgi:hypothetical protein